MGEEDTPLQPLPSGGSKVKRAGLGLSTFLGALIAVFFIVIGYIYRDDCLGSPKLPQLLIISGGLALAVNLLEFCTVCGCTGSTGDYDAPGSLTQIVKIVTGLIYLVQFALFVFLCFLVYKLYPTVNYKEPKNYHYCNETLFLTVFGSLTLTLVMAAIGILVALCTLCELC